MPRCFAVVRTLERKKRSSTRSENLPRHHVRSIQLRDLCRQPWPWQAFLVVERDAVSDRPDDERDQEPRNRDRAADVEQQPLVPEDADEIGPHQLQRADRQQDPELGRADLQERQLERSAGVRGERDLDDQQVIRRQEGETDASGSCARRA